MEKTLELPPGDEQPLDEGRLAELVRQAIDRTLEDLRKLEVPQKLQRIIRPMGEGTRDVEATAPKYQDEVVYKYFHDIWRSEEAMALTDYLWDHGAIKNKFSGPDPQKNDWAYYAYFQIVIDPLLVALKQTAREHLIDAEAVAPWTVAQEKLEKSIEDVVAMYGKKTILITAFCTLGRLDLPSEDYQELASDIRLRKWTTRDVCIFLSRHGDNYLWDDFKAPYIERNFAEIAIPRKYGQGEQPKDVKEIIQDRLDLLKWSLLTTKDQELPVSEGTCLLTYPLDRYGGRFRREENVKCGQYTLDNAAIQRCRDLVQRFRSAIEDLQKPDDLEQALWHFGRACVASLPRDVLLEAVMGLDALLVQGPGDSRYKFSLHGAAILSDTDPNGEELHKTLKTIYDLRSRAAHGGRVEVEKFAPKTRKILAQAINAIVDLILGGTLNTEEGIPKGVEKYVLQKALSRDTDGL